MFATAIHIAIQLHDDAFFAQAERFSEIAEGEKAALCAT
jgi:hypothetical protein